MSILKATTTISVLRASSATGTDVVDRLADSYGTDTETTTRPQAVVSRGVRANIGSPSGTEQIMGGNQEIVAYKMQCDTVELIPTDQIRDESTGLIYDVVTAAQRSAFAGREYTQAILSRSRGAA